MRLMFENGLTFFRQRRRGDADRRGQPARHIVGNRPGWNETICEQGIHIFGRTTHIFGLISVENIGKQAAGCGN